MTTQVSQNTVSPLTVMEDFEIEPESVPGCHRQISLVERLELSLPTARLTPNSVILGNIDNDPLKDVEIAIGTGEGDLFIYKGKRKHAWKRSAGLGSISCLALGDLLGSNQNVLVVISTEGNCFIFDVPYQSPAELLQNKSQFDSERRDSLEPALSRGKYPPSEPKLGPSHQSHFAMATDHHEDKPTQGDLQISGDPNTSRGSSANWGGTAPRSDSSMMSAGAGSGVGGSLTLGDGTSAAKYVEDASGTSTMPTSKPVVHDDWVSNAPSVFLPSASSSSRSSLQSTVESIEESVGSQHGYANLGAPGSQSSLGAPGLSGSGHGKKEQQQTRLDRLEAMYRWFVAGNGTCAIIADIDEDKQCELVIGSSNRVVYSYGIVHEVDAMGLVSTKLKLKNKWNVPGQVGSLSLSHDRWGRPVLVIAQHGGNYTTIDHRGATKYRQLGNPEPISHVNANDERNAPTQIRHASRQPFSIIGVQQDPVLLAMVGLDGTIILQEGSSSEVLWEHQLDHQLFALSVLDLTGDGQQELIACSWDGATFIFDQMGNCVEFQFEERVAAFVAGTYSVTKGNPQPVLVFVTFTDQLLIYYNIPIKSIPVSSLISRLSTQFEACRNTKIDKGGPWTRSEQARLVKSLLDPSKFDETAAEAYRQSLLAKLQESSPTTTP